MKISPQNFFQIVRIKLMFEDALNSSPAVLYVFRSVTLTRSSFKAFLQLLPSFGFYIPSSNVYPLRLFLSPWPSL